MRHQQVLRSNEPFFRFSNPANVAKSLLDGNREHLLLKIMKQEYKVDSHTCIGELQQTYAQRLELEDAHFAYEEELVTTEKELRLEVFMKWET